MTINNFTSKENSSNIFTFCYIFGYSFTKQQLFYLGDQENEKPSFYLYHTLFTTKKISSIHGDCELFNKMGAKRNFAPFFFSSLFSTMRKEMKGIDFTGGCENHNWNRLVAPESKFALTNFPVLSFLCRFPHAHNLIYDEGKSSKNRAFSRGCVCELKKKFSACNTFSNKLIHTLMLWMRQEHESKEEDPTDEITRQFSMFP